VLQQHVALCCSVLQCVEVCYSSKIFSCVWRLHLFGYVLDVVWCSSVLHCVVVCCSSEVAHTFGADTL